MKNSSNYVLPSDTYFTSNDKHIGLSNIGRQHCLVNKKTDERINLYPITDIARTGKLKNLTISKKMKAQLRVATV